LSNTDHEKETGTLDSVNNEELAIGKESELESLRDSVDHLLADGPISWFSKK